ncbi:MAG: sulfite exporter TauE/SafE family protein [Bdellovibrio sp.]|nr:sulfite exporter TauE/SafE family protein [Bdellovibrio sp.]
MGMDFTSIILLLTALLTSIMSGTIGMGGGILLLAVMGQYFPLQILIPLHGLIQLGSNASRVVYSYKSFDRRVTLQFAGGAILGAIIGSQLVIKIPDQWYKVGLGLFILSITFIPLPGSRKTFRFKWSLVGGISTFLGLFVGATGPLIAPFYLSENWKKDVLVATKAACQVFTHLLKVATFIIMGFAVSHHLLLLMGMLAMVFIGNYIGKWILDKLPDRWFIWAFKSLIVILSARMIFQGLTL